MKENSERFLNGAALLEEMGQGAILLDIRQPQQFVSGHLVGSLNITFHPVSYAQQVGFFVPVSRSLVLVCESAPERLAATFSLLQAGFNIIGYTKLIPGLLLEVFSQLTIHQLWQQISQGRLQRNMGLLDVRSLAEWNEYHIEGAIHIPYCDIPRRLQELDRHKELVVVAGTHYHSLTVISFLRQHGFDLLGDVPAGMTGWARSGLPIKRGS